MTEITKEKVEELSKPTYQITHVTCDNPFGYCDGYVDDNGYRYNAYGRICSRFENTDLGDEW